MTTLAVMPLRCRNLMRVRNSGMFRTYVGPSFGCTAPWRCLMIDLGYMLFSSCDRTRLAHENGRKTPRLKTGNGGSPVAEKKPDNLGRNIWMFH